ncbi:hypothetical protein SNEBB_001898 [Seison nebaliae]|nr:hypothetical protein SNEBB_001898 [Seison nebaliae]
MPAVTVCTPHSEIFSSSYDRILTWIYLNDLYSYLSANCSAELDNINYSQQSIICSNPYTDGTILNKYPEWNNKTKIEELLFHHLSQILVDSTSNIFIIKHILIFFDIYYKETAIELGDDNIMVLKDYDMNKVTKILVSINPKDIPDMNLRQYLLVTHFNCNLNGQPINNVRKFLYQLFSEKCLTEKQEKIILFNFFAEEIRRRLPGDKIIRKNVAIFIALKYLRLTLDFELIKEEIYYLSLDIQRTLKDNIIGGLYISTNLLLRYVVKTVIPNKKFKDTRLNLRDFYIIDHNFQNIAECTFNDRKCKNEEISFLLTKGRSCYKFETTTNTSTSLHILVIGTTTKRTTNTKHVNSVIISFQERGKIPSFLDNQINLRNGTHALINVIPNQRNMLNTSHWGNCVEPSDEFKKKHNIKGRYSRFQCIQECLFTFVIDRCKCQMYYDEANRYGVKYCNTYLKVHCMFFISKYFQWRKYCRYCPRECTMVNYQTQLISKPMKNKIYKDKYANCDEDQTMSIIIGGTNGNSSNYNAHCRNTKNFNEISNEIEINYNHQVFEEFTQKKSISFSTTLSQIGGSLGFCIGASCITFFELLLYLYLQMIYLLKRH